MGSRVLHLEGAPQSGQSVRNWRQQEGQDALVFESRKRQAKEWISMICASVQKVQNMIPSKVGSPGNSLEESDGCRGRRAEAHGRWSRTGTAQSTAAGGSET